MEIGFAVPVSGSWATPEHMIHVARRAEQLGYHSLWTFQRLLVPADLGWSETYHSVQDPLTTLAFLAAHTGRIRLGVAVLNMPFLSPVVLAKQTATLDILAAGRLDLGLGLGWAEEEYQATGASRQQRGRRAEEFLTVLRSLWQEEVTAYRGEFYQVPPTRMQPKPVQRPHPPILLGGHAPAALHRAGRLADGWVSGSQADLTGIGEAVATVKAAAAGAGRDPEALRFVCRGAVRVRTAGLPDREPLTGTLDQIRSDVGGLAAAGITELFLDLNFDPEIGSPRADPYASLRRADEVLDALAPGR
ncbi:TIGR03619 family F420-dependent LLM class oxidoreductase [Micromonospora sp. DR5-3]|uniref:TIGR03619 family F420-dependent LLM class oxidoreductase n=1 Tax=unclassified Micromonospora TaxID=2617518 RepID=UPI0011D32709|nr:MULTISPECIES: TIGR03619 family F420-dependent LLM class oxidoreductase [unclassified Micromonospora]MCW3816055.1 TIGR03619 family F420-dependent LLM class oxidoreductase [Micromonospora sp. DR5-3]TYC21268.1 TIGR03619 family F420-dependent LLM class oxidoreductase [Micromonospora sp. MP36]